MDTIPSRFAGLDAIYVLGSPNKGDLSFTMGPDLELKGRSDTMDVLASKENKSSVRDSVDNHITCRTDYKGNMTRMEDSLYEQAEQETIGHLVFKTGKSRSSLREPLDKHISCTSNHEDSMFELHDQPADMNTMKHHEVNIVECTHSFDDSSIEIESKNSTESSSSYDDTAFGDENDAVLSDPEVMSQLHSDEFGDLARIRKKRLTSHWKTYIQSHAWRCKWVELQIRRFLSQASKYDMQLAHSSKRKQLRPNRFTIEDLGVELLPLPSNTQRDTVMKRKKRKRVEDTIDKAAYIAQHNLFSYFGDRRSSAVVRSFGDGWENRDILMDKKVSTNSGFGLTDEPISLEFSDDDNSIEQILLKIWNLESRVREMQTRVKEVMSVDAKQISSPRKLSVPVPCNTFIGSAQNLVSPPNNGDQMLVQSSFNASQLLPQYNMGDLVIPASAVSSHEKRALLPDDIERTVQFQFGTSYKNSDGHLMNKRKAKEKLNISEEVEILNIEKFKAPSEEQEGTIPSSPVLEGLLTDDQPNPKALPVSKVASNTRRKRGRQ